MLLKGWNFDQQSLPSESAENACFHRYFSRFTAGAVMPRTRNSASSRREPLLTACLTHHGKVLRNAHAELTCLVHGAQCHQIAVTEYRFRRD